jgi:hypothetical protein
VNWKSQSSWLESWVNEDKVIELISNSPVNLSEKNLAAQLSAVISAKPNCKCTLYGLQEKLEITVEVIKTIPILSSWKTLPNTHGSS